MSNLVPFNMDQVRKDMVLADKSGVDWHSMNTITFGSLLDDGFDWGANEWTCYTMDPTRPQILASVRTRLNRKIVAEFYFRELGVLPPGKFKMFLIREINKAMDQVGPIYLEIAKGFDLSTVSSEFTKERDIKSEYPQAQLSPETKDYASSADERASQTTISRGQLDIFEEFGNFREPDSIVLAAIEPCFSNLFSNNF